MLDFDTVTFLLIAYGIGRFLLSYNARFFRNLTYDAAVCDSPIETQLYRALQREGISVIPQYQIGRYRLDFAVFSGGKKINVECDGKAYHSTFKQLAHDRKRDQFMRENGWIVVRFSGSQIYRSAKKCARKVKYLVG